MMDGSFRHVKAIALITLLLLLAVPVSSAKLKPKCPDSCSPVDMSCRCGVMECNTTRACGYYNVDGDKSCFSLAEVGNNECQIRGWVIAGRILCIMLLLAPYVALAMVVLGAVNIILGSDNPPQRITGKKWVKNAIFGSLMVLALIQISNYYLQMNLDYTTCSELGGCGSAEAGDITVGRCVCETIEETTSCQCICRLCSGNLEWTSWTMEVGENCDKCTQAECELAGGPTTTTLVATTSIEVAECCEKIVSMGGPITATYTCELPSYCTGDFHCPAPHICSIVADTAATCGGVC